MPTLSNHLCECGCGGYTNLASRTVRKHGWVKGHPVRFIKCHGKRVQKIKDGYYRHAMSRGEELPIHRIRAEKALGKPLPKGAEVHHADGSRDPNAPLVICQDRAYHFLLHVRMAVKKAGGNPNTDRICWRCKQPKPMSDFHIRRSRPSGRVSICKPCALAHNREWVARQKRGAA